MKPMLTNKSNLVKGGFNKVFVDLTVKSMLNPDNKDFYIVTISTEKVERLLRGMDNEAVEVFWNAFNIAQSTYLDTLTEYGFPTDALEDRLNDIRNSVCPECGCRDYICGVTCPNCEYVEE